MATSLAKSENKVQIHHLHPKRCHYGEKIVKIGPAHSEIFDKIGPLHQFLWPSHQTFTNELCQLWSSCTEFHDIFTRHRPRGIICAVNAHTEIAISHSISECQSDEYGEFAIFYKIGF